MMNPRQLINQLRVAYFVPTRDKYELSPSEICINQSMCVSPTIVAIYGMCKFHTPVVPYVGSIPSVVTVYNGTQTPSLVHTDDPHRSFVSGEYVEHCRPSIKYFTLPKAPLQESSYSLGLMDCSSCFRQGYRNMFHQFMGQWETFPLLQKGQPFNIFF